MSSVCISRRESRQFLTTIKQTVPADLAIHLVLDNYSTRKALTVKRWVAQHPQYHLHFTPPRAPG
jgi:hypothetical protein